MQSARLLKRRGRGAIWQRREDDFNLWSEKNRVEKLRHIPRRPVKTTQGDEVERLRPVKPFQAAGHRSSFTRYRPLIAIKPR